MPDLSPHRRRLLAGGAAALVLVGVVGGGILSRSHAEREEAAIATANALPTVSVIHPQSAAAGTFTLPGTVAAYNEAAINARTSGYVAKWYADIGDHVRAGQVLAVLDAPEVSEQLAQARADLQSAIANRQLAETTADRWQTLHEKDAVSQQETDEKQGAFKASAAAANAARANVDRLRAMMGFTRITAPFAGIVTSRSAQIGALVSAGNGAAKPLFTVADVSHLRVYVHVPQNQSGRLTKGLVAKLTVPEHPGETFDATLVRNAGAVDPDSGTVLTEFDVGNADGRLKPGGFAEVAIPLVGAAGTVRVPASSLILGPNGSMVALVDAAGRVTLRPVTVGHDEGKTIEILAGLSAGDRVIQTPPDALATGDRVRIVTPGKAGAGHAKS